MGAKSLDALKKYGEIDIQLQSRKQSHEKYSTKPNPARKICNWINSLSLAIVGIRGIDRPPLPTTTITNLFPQKVVRKREVQLSRINIYIVVILVLCHSIRILPNTWEIVHTFYDKEEKVSLYSTALSCPGVQ